MSAKMKKRILIVGAGLAGCTCARLLADDYSITLIDKSPELGGLCKDMKLITANCYYHRYGIHVFHTKKKYIWDFVNKFMKFREYHLQQRSLIDGFYYHFPVNLNTIEEVYQTDVHSESDVNKLIHDKKYTNPKNFEEYAINDIGTKLYEMFIKSYTEKQWQCSCDKLPSSVYKRVSIRYNRDNDLFQNQYQGLPVEGYTNFMYSLIQHPNIEFIPMMEYNYFDTSEDNKYERIIYTGSYEGLPYRSTQFIMRADQLSEDYSLVSLPQDSFYVRRTNCTSLHAIDPNNTSASSICVYEAPMKNNSGALCLPINTQDNGFLYMKKRFEFMNLHPSSILVGRLSTYKYMNMDETIDQCFKTLSKENMIDASKYFK